VLAYLVGMAEKKGVLSVMMPAYTRARPSRRPSIACWLGRVES